MTKTQKIEALLMHNVEEAKKAPKDVDSDE